MKIYKRDSGVVFEDDFSRLIAGWAISEPPAVSINDGLVLEHRENKDIRVLRDIPAGANVFYIKIDYTPTESDDEAGVILYRDNQAFVELLEFKNGDPNELTDVRITKNGNSYTFEMLRNNEWEFIDSCDYAFKKIGFVTKQGSDTFEPLKITNFLATTNGFLTVKNLMSDFTAELNGVTVTANSDGFAEIPISHGKESGMLKVYDELGVLVTEIDGEYVAGDVWNLGSFLLLKRDGEILSHFDPTNLGRVVNGHLEVQLEVENPATFAALDLKLQVVKYSTQPNGKVGWEWVDLAWDDSGDPTTYSKEITINLLNADSSLFFWVRIDKNSAVPQISNAVYFTIYLKHE